MWTFSSLVLLRIQVVGYSEDWIEVGRACGVGPGMIVVAPEKVVGIVDETRLVVAHGKLGVLEDGKELVGHLGVAQWSRTGLDVASSLGYK